MAKEWSNEVADAFVTDFYEAGFRECATHAPRGPITFLAEVAKETKLRPPVDMSKYLVLL